MGGPETPKLIINTPPEPDVENPVETLDDILQSKISDKTVLNNAKSIFAKVQENFTDPIDDYVKGLDFDEMDYIVNTASNPVEYVIEDIGGTNTNAVINVTDDKKDVVQQKNDVTQQKKDATDQKTNIVQQEEDKVALEQAEKQKTPTTMSKIK